MKKISLLLPAAASLLWILQGSPASLAAPAGQDGVTYETWGDFQHSVYANGQPLLIEASQLAGYARLYVDANGNGVGEAEEEITAFQGAGTLDGGGIFYLEGYGYWLSNSSVYGGAKDGERQYDTNITLSGPCPTAGGSNLTVRLLYGGSQSGSLTGSTHVTISGGNPGWVYGGSGSGEINGDTYVSVTGGYMEKNIYGGSSSGGVNGSTHVSVQGGSVTSVYGGNENSGAVFGDTRLVFEDGSTAKGWIYAGGAGYSDDAVTEVLGSANILVNGGSFSRNLYGGGGWRGARVGSSSVVVNGGDLSGCWVYAGGEETSCVTGKACVTVNGGTVGAVCASGAGFNGTRAEVGDADICLNGGKVNTFSALSSESAAINGSLTLSLSGDTFSDTELYLGNSHNPNRLSTVSVTVQNAVPALLQLQSPVENSLSVSFENGGVSRLVLFEGTLADAEEATLTYLNCGSAEGRWGSLVQNSALQGYFEEIDNPLLTGSALNHNKFTSVVLKNSYIVYHDDSTTDDDNGPRACMENLTVDGGALRVAGNMRTYMPRTEFSNTPLLLRTSSFYSGLNFAETPDGCARIQWLDNYGTGIPDNMETHCIAETPSDAPDSIFLPGVEGFALKTENGSVSSASGVLWQGRVWQIGPPEKFCRCQILSAGLEETVFALPEGEPGITVTLRDSREGNTDVSENCPVIGHRGTAAACAYSLLSQGTTAPDASLKGSLLTVSGVGTVHVQVEQSLHGLSSVYDAYVNILEAPEKTNYIFAKESREDIVFRFRGLAFDEGSSYLYNNTEHNFAEAALHSIVLEDGVLCYTLKKDYLKTLPEGQYSFDAGVCFRPEPDKPGTTRYTYRFTVDIVPSVEVSDPLIELAATRFPYIGAEHRPQVTVKDGDTVISSDEYLVSYENNFDVGQARVIVTDIPGGVYTVSGSAVFDIVNTYRPANGTDYVTSSAPGSWTDSDFVITAVEGHLLSEGNTLTDEWTDRLIRSEETADGRIAFYVKDSATGEISLAAEEPYKLDKTLPEQCDIFFDGDSVKGDLDSVSFGLFLRAPVKVRITALDSLSGIDGVSCLRAESPLTEEQLKTADGWSDNTDFVMEGKDGEPFLLYVRVADRAGNTVYFSSRGGEFDLTPPTVEGADNGRVCHTTQSVTVTDRNLAAVSVNGQTVTGTITLPGDTDQAYFISALDKAGNETAVTVIMKPIVNLESSLKNLSIQNVTSDRKSALTSVLATDISDATPEEREKMLRLFASCSALLNRISEVEQDLARLENAVNRYDAESVSSTHRPELEALLRDIELLAGSQNLTEAERGKVMNFRTAAAALLESALSREDDDAENDSQEGPAGSPSPSPKPGSQEGSAKDPAGSPSPSPRPGSQEGSAKDPAGSPSPSPRPGSQEGSAKDPAGSPSPSHRPGSQEGSAGSPSPEASSAPAQPANSGSFLRGGFPLLPAAVLLAAAGLAGAMFLLWKRRKKEETGE